MKRIWDTDELATIWFQKHDELNLLKAGSSGEPVGNKPPILTIVRVSIPEITEITEINRGKLIGVRAEWR